MIFTFMRAFDLQANWDYVEHVKSIFELYGTEFYYVELIAPQSVRLACSTAENRLRSNPSKRNLDWSNSCLLEDDAQYCLVSREGRSRSRITCASTIRILPPPRRHGACRKRLSCDESSVIARVKSTLRSVGCFFSAFVL